MDIYINDEKIDFSLQQERTLGDVLQGVGAWLLEESFSIGELVVDGKPITLPIGSVDLDRHVDDISNIHIAASSTLEEHHQHLSTLYEFFSIFYKAIVEEDQEAVTEVLVEMPFVAESLDNLLSTRTDIPSSESRGYSETLVTLVGETCVDGNLPQGAGKAALKNYLEGLLTIVRERISEIAEPLRELKKTIVTLGEMVPKLSEVSVLLQTGEDREAMNRVIVFADLYAKLIRLYKPLKVHGIMDSNEVSIDGQPLQEYYIGINQYLRELNDAFENNDSVLIGDLLEYEIAPKLDALAQALDGIEQ